MEEGMDEVQLGMSLLVREALRALLKSPAESAALPLSMVADLLAVDDNAVQTESPPVSVQGRGYPRRPLYRLIAAALLEAGTAGCLPELEPLAMAGVKDDNVICGLDIASLSGFTTSALAALSSGRPPVETCALIRRLRAVMRRKEDPVILKDSCGYVCSVPAGIVQGCSSALLLLGAAGVLALLGMRRTGGSVDACPPRRECLIDAFVTRHRPLSASSLTVGARAVAKHCPRSGEGFWGQCRGSEAAKNSAARALLDLMLENCVWINLHRMSGLDGSSAVLELRIPAGYGMRWTVPVQPGAGGGVQFRGCLEPAMPDGHSLGWHHP